MADSLKSVYFPEIPDVEPLQNATEGGSINGRDIIPGSIDMSSIELTEGENTIWGYEALLNIKPYGVSGIDPNQGRRNTAVGYQALKNLVYGHDNVAIGYRALYTLAT